MAILLGLSGCTALGDACCNVWSLEGEDARVFPALGGLLGVEEVRREGLLARHARLDAAWGEYALVGISAPGGALSVRPGIGELTLGSDADPDREALRAGVLAFLREVLAANESELEQLADEALANATPLLSGGPPHAAGSPPPAGPEQVSGYHYSVRTSLPVRAQEVFDAKTRGATWEPTESYGRDLGSVDVGGWTFTFAFPWRRAEVALADGASLRVDANSHGGLLGVLRAGEAVEERDARRRVSEALGGLDVAGWSFEGSVEGGRAPPGSLPTPTP